MQVLTAAIVRATDLESVQALLCSENADMFSVPLSASGTDPATHWGACGVVDRNQVAFDGVTWFRWDIATGSLTESSDPEVSFETVSWPTVLASLRLVPILVEE